MDTEHSWVHRMGRSREAQKHRAQHLTVVAWQCSLGGKPVRDHIPDSVLESATGGFLIFLDLFYLQTVYNIKLKCNHFNVVYQT